MTAEIKLAQLGLIKNDHVKNEGKVISFKDSCSYCYKIFTDGDRKICDLMYNYHESCYLTMRKSSCHGCNFVNSLNVSDQKSYCLDGVHCTEGCGYIRYVSIHSITIFSQGYSCNICYKYCCGSDCLVKHLKRKHFEIVLGKNLLSSYELSICCPGCHQINGEKETYYRSNFKMFIRNSIVRDHALSNKLCENCTVFITKYHQANEFNKKHIQDSSGSYDNNDNLTDEGKIPPYIHCKLHLLPGDKRLHNYYFNDFANSLMNSRLPKISSKQFNTFSFYYEKNTISFLKDCSTIKELVIKLEKLANEYFEIINSIVNFNVITNIIVDYHTWQLIPFYKMMTLIMEIVDRNK